LISIFTSPYVVATGVVTVAPTSNFSACSTALFDTNVAASESRGRCPA
jgi:hypothetical protein